MNLRIFRKVMVGLSAVTCLVSPSYASGDANSSFFTEKRKTHRLSMRSGKQEKNSFKVLYVTKRGSGYRCQYSSER